MVLTGLRPILGQNKSVCLLLSSTKGEMRDIVSSYPAIGQVVTTSKA